MNIGKDLDVTSVHRSLHVVSNRRSNIDSPIGTEIRNRHGEKYNYEPAVLIGRLHQERLAVGYGIRAELMGSLRDVGGGSSYTS